MRIIVVMTFIVVSVIVTVLTYIFFRDMESDVLHSNFADISTNLAADTARSLDRKASSTKALSKLYTGILGTQRETGPMNESPSVILSSSALECTEGKDGDWKRIWPNVTLPGHDEIVSAMLGVSKSRAAIFAPFLWGNRLAWEEYAANEALPQVKDVASDGIRSSSGYSVQEDPKDTERDQQAFIDDFSLLSNLRVPVWQVAPAELMEEGIMWDLVSHPPYKAPIHRILEWTNEEEEGKLGDDFRRRSMSSHDAMVASAVGEPPVVSTELIPCAKTLLPVHLNPVPNVDPIQLSGHSDEHHGGHRRSQSVGEAEGLCSAFFYPVYDAHPSERSSSNITGIVAEIFSWTDVFMHLNHGQVHNVAEVIIESKLSLPDGSHRPHQSASYLLNADGASFVGMGRLVGKGHKEMMHTFGYSNLGDNLTYTFEVYPSDELCYKEGISGQAAFLSVIAACFFFLSVFVFFVYDYFVNYRQKIVVRSAAHSTRIVNSLYPQFVRENLFGNENQTRKDAPVDQATNTNSTQEYDEEDPQVVGGTSVLSASVQKRKGLKSKVSDFVDTPATQLKRFLNHPMPSREYDYNLCTEIGEMEPIAEVFEKTTVMLADIEGFTAWCSEREPSQVFRLLETVYREFDIEARKLGVFKVETVGDCYVAVTGLPDQRDDHAIVIAKYAVRCLLKFNVLTKRLEANLGPGTASLGMRFGLHSGPVMAGVLRGEKSRFQLFGDTINVASRMESTGEKNMIQVSQDTADLLNASGKGHWLTPRDGPVSAKGKGSILTYWLQPNRRRPSMHGSLRQNMSETANSSSDAKVPTVSLDRALRQSWKCIGIDNDTLVAKERLIRWNAAILESFLLKIVDNRNIHSAADAFLDQFIPSKEDKHLSFSEKLSETVMFPEVAYRDDYYGVSSDVAISSDAQIELLEYVAKIASMYRDVPFHNFDHASHVTMSANKLLNRVCTTFEDEEEDISSVAARTFGISADPLAQFVVVFSSLVHDVDHQGVPNAQLVKELDPLAIQFDNRSVAEKRSITIAWNVLMEDRFRELQSLIFVNGDEMRRFKQLLINTVLATDIADKKRSAIGKIRWQKAFHPSQSSSHNSLDESSSTQDRVANLRSLKATLVFEQIMQASDVAHTMQHWETFKKWNVRLYKELSKGYREGRGASDPREGWYPGEIGFFDFYIIPLAKKLKECGVFGSAASEYLDYALENRRRWEEEGTEIARKMVLENDSLLAKTVPPQNEAVPAQSKDDALAKGSSSEGSPKKAESPKNDVPAELCPPKEAAPTKSPVSSIDSPGELV